MGDQLTCKNIRGAKNIRRPEPTALLQLQWAQESPGIFCFSSHVMNSYLSIGDFHFLWECLGLSYQTFWGSPSTVGSLHHLKDVIDRRSVDNAAKKFQSSDEFFQQVLFLTASPMQCKNVCRFFMHIWRLPYAQF